MMGLVGLFAERLQGRVQEFIDQTLEGLTHFAFSIVIQTVHLQAIEKAGEFFLLGSIGLIAQTLDRRARAAVHHLAQEFFGLFIDDLFCSRPFSSAELDVTVADLLQIVDAVQINF